MVLFRCLGLLSPGFEKEQPKHVDLQKSFQNINHWGESGVGVYHSSLGDGPTARLSWSPLCTLPSALCPLPSALCLLPSALWLCSLGAHKRRLCPGPEELMGQKFEEFALVSFIEKLA